MAELIASSDAVMLQLMGMETKPENWDEQMTMRDSFMNELNKLTTAAAFNINDQIEKKIKLPSAKLLKSFLYTNRKTINNFIEYLRKAKTSAKTNALSNSISNAIRDFDKSIDSANSWVKAHDLK